MSRRVSKDDSPGGETENFPTPSWCVRRLLEDAAVERMLRTYGDGLWLEPSAGSGALIEACEEAAEWCEPTWVACELRAEEESNLVRTLHGAGVALIGDFLTAGRHAAPAVARERCADGHQHRPFAVCIGNPPYSLAQEFVQACQPLATFTIMLLRMNFLHSAERHPWFAAGNMPAYAKALPDRPNFVLGASDSCEYGWMIWTPAPCHETRVTLLAPTPVRERRPFLPSAEIVKMLFKAKGCAMAEDEIWKRIESRWSTDESLPTGAFDYSETLFEMVQRGFLSWVDKGDDVPLERALTYRLAPRTWKLIWEHDIRGASFQVSAQLARETNGAHR